MASMESQWERLAQAVAAARNARGWNQEDLAQEAGVSRSTIQNLEGSGARQYKRLPPVAVVVEQALGWPPGTAKGILAGGDPPPVAQTVKPASVSQKKLSAGMPLRVAEELTSGEVVDTVVMNLSGDESGMRLVAVLKADDAAKVDPETYRRTLEEWVQTQRRLHGLPTNETSSDAADGA